MAKPYPFASHENDRPLPPLNGSVSPIRTAMKYVEPTIGQIEVH